MIVTRKTMKKQFDRRHPVRELPMLEDNTPVCISSGRNTFAIPGNVIQPAGQRTYQVQTPTRITRRNRSFLQERPVELDEHSAVQAENTNQEEETEQTVVQRSPILTRERTGTTINPPDKLNL